MDAEKDQYRMLMENLPDACAYHKIITDKDGTFVDYLFLEVNRAFEEMFGLTKDQITGKRITEVFSKIKGTSYDWIKSFGRVALVGEDMRLEYYYKPTDSWYEITSYSHIPGFFAVIFRDITGRRRAEGALKETRQKLETIIRDVPDIIYRLDPKGRIVFVSDAVKAYGYTPEEMLGTSMLDYVHPEDRKMAACRIKERRTGGRRTISFQVRLLPKEANPRRFEVKYGVVLAEPVFLLEAEGLYSSEEISAGSFAGTHGVIREITERKLAEEALRKAEETYRNIFLNSQVGLFRTDLKTGQLLDANDAVAKFLGFANREELLARPFSIAERYVDPQARQAMVDLLQKNGAINNHEARFRRKDGSIRVFRYSARLVPEKGWIEGVSEDITERKESEAALKESESRFRTLVSNVPGVFFRCNNDRDWTMHYISEDIEELTGYPAHEFIRNRVRTFASVIHPDDLELVNRIVREGITIRKTYLVRYRIIRADGNIRWVRENGQAVFDDSGNDTGKLLYLDGVMMDITERKQAEEALRQSEEKFRTLVEKSHEGIMIIQKGTYAFANPRLCELLGVPAGSLEGKPFIHSIWPDDREMVLDNHRKRLAGEPYKEAYDLRIVGAGGRLTWVFLSVSVIQWEGKNAMLGLVTDITERKQAGEALRRREQEFRALAENAPDIVARFDRNLRHIYINPAIEKHTGIPREEFMGRTNDDLSMPKEQVKLWNSKLGEVFQCGRETEMFFDYLAPGGRKHYHSRIVPEFAPGGTVETVLAINRDITPVKEMEAVLYRERVKAHKLLKRSLPDDLPALPGLALAASYRFASTPMGDYYNVIQSGDRLLFYLVDAGGDRENGIMHSLYLRSAIDSYLSAREDGAELSPVLLLRYLVDQHRRDHQAETSPIGLLIGVINLAHIQGGLAGMPGNTKELRCATWGFCAPFLSIKDGKPVERFINEANPSLGDGTDRQVTCVEYTAPLAPGTTIIFRTGGPFRLEDESGQRRFRDICAAYSHLPPELISRAIDEEIAALCSTSPTHDHDFAAVVIQVPEQEQRISFTLESDFEYINPAREKTAALLCSRFQLQTDLLNFHELLVNAIEHGNKRDGGKKVWVDITVTDTYYRITVTDQGEGFNWRERINNELDWESESERGRGIIMTRMMSDYLGYNERGNKVTMINLLE